MKTDTYLAPIHKMGPPSRMAFSVRGWMWAVYAGGVKMGVGGHSPVVCRAICWFWMDWPVFPSGGFLSALGHLTDFCEYHLLKGPHRRQTEGDGAGGTETYF